MHDDSPNPPETPHVARIGDESELVEDTTTSDTTAVPWLSEAEIERSRRALLVWLGILLVFGVGGLALGQQELALLVAVSGVVMAAHAADFHPRFNMLYEIVSFALIATCSVSLIGLGAALVTSDLPAGARVIVPALALIGGLVMLSTAALPVARALAWLLFRAKGESHSYRLAARLTLFGFLLAVPLWFAAQNLFSKAGDVRAVFANLSSGGAVLGYVILALASVGFLVRRDVRSTFERLGLTRPRPRDLLLVVIGVPALFGLNWAGEWGQKHWFPSLWESDHRINDMIAAALDRRGMIVLALSAGIGEEITMRGALQPKLGLVLTSLFFAALHVQYSWYGMVMIFVFGLILGMIRNRSNTVTAMTVHAIYDLAALMFT